MGRSLQQIPRATDKPAPKAEEFIKAWGLEGDQEYVEDPTWRHKGRPLNDHPLDVDDPEVDERKGTLNTEERKKALSEEKHKQARRAKQHPHADSAAGQEPHQAEVGKRHDNDEPAAAKKQTKHRITIPTSSKVRARLCTSSC